MIGIIDMCDYYYEASIANMDEWQKHLSEVMRHKEDKSEDELLIESFDFDFKFKFKKKD